LPAAASDRTGPFVPFTILIRCIIHHRMQLNLHNFSTHAENARTRSGERYPANSFERPPRQGVIKHQRFFQTMHSNVTTFAASHAGTTRFADFARNPLHSGRAEPSVPVFSRNREYNRALRQAELAVWEFGKPVAKGPAESLSALGAPHRESGAEKALYALLTASCAVAIGFAFVDSAQLLQHWNAFLRGVRTLLG